MVLYYFVSPPILTTMSNHVGPLQIYYEEEIQIWLGQNPANAINAISKTGIAPLYPTFFEGGMFAPATVIEKRKSTRDGQTTEDVHLAGPSGIDYNSKKR